MVERLKEAIMSDFSDDASRQRAEAMLVRELRNGSGDAQRRFYLRFAPIIYQFSLIYFAGDVPLAEDIMMQTIAEGLLNLHHFNPRRANLTTWLYGIARRHIRDELRHRYRRKSIPPALQLPLEVAQGISDTADLAEGVAARIDRQRQLAQIVKVLSEQELEALILLYVEQCSIREISQIIGRTEAAVYSILHRARQKAREKVVPNELCD